MGYDSQGPNTDTTGLTDSLWRGMIRERLFCPWDRQLGVGMFDDFIGFGGALSTNDGQYFTRTGRYISYQTASTFIVPVAFSPTPASVAPTSRGAIKFSPTSGVADNDIMSLQWGGQLATPYGCFPFSMIPSYSGDLVFEARIKTSSVTASIGDIFIGLAGAAGVQLMTAVLPILDADTMAETFSWVGFARLAAETTSLKLGYCRTSGTQAWKTAVGTLAADTYIKVGFRWDGNYKTLTPWIDGVEKTGSMVSSATTAATPWPNDYMTPIICCKQIDGTTANELTVDWWACAQLNKF
jgi:hypothetical protein